MMLEDRPIHERALEGLKLLKRIRGYALDFMQRMERNPDYVFYDHDVVKLRSFWEQAKEAVPEMARAMREDELLEHIRSGVKEDLFTIAAVHVPRAEDLIMSAVDESRAGVIDLKSKHDAEMRILISMLHPRIVQASMSFFRDQHYREAVRKACDELTLLLRRKTGVEQDGEDLVNQSLAPKNPKIVLAQGSSNTAESIRNGYHALARGVFAGIRNPYMHEPDMKVDAVVAARHLVTISSVMARIEAKPWSKIPQIWNPTEGPELPL